MTRVYISPHISQIADDNGVGRVVHAQYRHLPDYGVELVGSPEQAEVIAAHISQGDLPRVDVHHCHGLYWTGDAGSGQYNSWHHRANAEILNAARQAYAITVPSDWVAMPFKRDMRLSPVVIGHGIDLAQWAPGQNKGYLFWNKNRAGDVCDPAPAVALAERGAEVVTTFVRAGHVVPETLRIIGPQPAEQMRHWVSEAGIYLATTKETFGIGTIEALACGVPVLGYRWGGTAELVRHQETGYLVDPGDIDGLAQGLEWIEAHRDQLSEACLEAARAYDWSAIIGQYAELYERVAEQRRTEKRGVSIVITNYNYGGYVGEAIESCLNQTLPADEIIVVDDGSTDHSRDVLDQWKANNPQVHCILQENRGVAAARNVGIQAATRPYLVCLDADDRLDSRFIQSLLPHLQHDRGLGIVYSGIKLLWSDGRETLSEFPPAFDWERQATVADVPATCIPSGSMFRRDMWVRAGGYQQVWAPGEDTEFWTRGLSVGFKAQKATDEPLFHYRLHEGSASRTRKYRRIDDWHPWMRDKRYPMGAPAAAPPLVRSYSEPLISVVIPVGPGHVRYLPSALDSLLGQTFRNWEAIVVDDSHAVEIPEWDQPLQTYPFVRLVNTSGGLGAGYARNVGLAHARGRFTVFLDADDYLMPQALERMLWAFVEHGNEARYIYTDWLALRDGKFEPHQTPVYEQRAWLERGQHAITTLLLTEDARGVGGFDETMVGWEDWDFFIRLALSGVCGYRLPEVLLGYRMHSGQRRETSMREKDNLLATLRRRYGAYAKGDKTMAGCCGGHGRAVIEAKQALGDPALSVAGMPQETQARPIQPAAVVRMEFVGPEVGAVTFLSDDGQRRYRGGNNAFDRYADVDPRDVDRLLLTGKWRSLARVAPAIPAPETPAPTQEAPAPGQPTPEQPVPETDDPWGARPLLEPSPEELAAEALANAETVKHVRKTRRSEHSVK